MIELKNASAVYGKKTVFSNVSLKLNNGNVYGFYATKGTGISTLLALLGGAKAPKEGEVKINGFDLYREPKKAKNFIGFVPEQDVIYDRMTPTEYLLFVADLKGMEYERSVRAVSEALDLFYLTPKRDVLIRSLSAFEKRCLCIAQATLGESSILILDAPTKGLDGQERKTMLRLLDEIAEGRTLILGSSSAEELQKACDRVFRLSENGVEEITRAKNQTSEEEEETEN